MPERQLVAKFEMHEDCFRHIVVRFQVMNIVRFIYIGMVTVCVCVCGVRGLNGFRTTETNSNDNNIFVCDKKNNDL